CSVFFVLFCFFCSVLFFLQTRARARLRSINGLLASQHQVLLLALRLINQFLSCFKRAAGARQNF
ncbi:MAG TPA: hypothetical protein PKW98_06840, partial [Candidatus Wallbacteria bacterium]|nr:hypothetical protein [Candidatus Wallbacteria bacterium]